MHSDSTRPNAPEPFDAQALFDRAAAPDEAPVREIGTVTRYAHDSIHKALIEHLRCHHRGLSLDTLEALQAELAADL